MAIKLVRVPASATATQVPALTGGFIQAIYVGNELASNEQKDALRVTIGTAGATATVIRPNVGSAIPDLATIANTSTTVFNILINS